MRISFSEVTFSRVIAGLKRRIRNYPLKLKWQYSRNGIESRNNLAKFKDIHRNQRCVLIANGPSLRKLDMSMFKDEITIGLNRVYLAFDDWGWETDYLVAINELVLSQYKDDILSTNAIKFLNWASIRGDDCDDRVYGIFKGLHTKPFSEDITKGLNFGATVTYAALQIAKYMGFKEVYIIGLDHNFPSAKYKMPNVTELVEENQDENHFLNNYFPKGHLWQTPDLVASNYFYRLAKDAFAKDDIALFDCTEGGKCDIFNKQSLSSIFK